MDFHTFGFSGNKKDILNKLKEMKSIIFNNPQPNEKLNIEELNKKITLLSIFNEDIVGSMIVTLMISNELNTLIRNTI